MAPGGIKVRLIRLITISALTRPRGLTAEIGLMDAKSRASIQAAEILSRVYSPHSILRVTWTALMDAVNANRLPLLTLTVQEFPKRRQKRCAQPIEVFLIAERLESAVQLLQEKTCSAVWTL